MKTKPIKSKHIKTKQIATKHMKMLNISKYKTYQDTKHIKKQNLSRYKTYKDTNISTIKLKCKTYQVTKHIKYKAYQTLNLLDIEKIVYESNYKTYPMQEKKQTFTFTVWVKL